MALEIRQREKEGIVILDLSGPLTVGEPAARVRQVLHDLLAADRKNVILNLRDVDYIDSTGLGAMVVCYTTLRKAGGDLKLLNLNRRNIELLVLTKLSTVFEIFADEQDAVNSFFPDRAIQRFDILAFLQQQPEPGDA
ncbi:MAG: STAS domain-containing protein [Bryobacterales bacterium]|nr:STAS domain-containing protein [Bryobacteraceae bacterium]MDW8355346.1 STAS domain-containing protein [Bryobacterales bacterium]